MKQFIPYDKSLKLKARKLRSNLTYGEAKLWNHLKNKQFNRIDFHRQKPILKYIVDFFSNELMLVIEIDGSSHDEFKYDYDQKRQKEIEALGILFLRFTEHDVLRNFDRVMETLDNWVKTHPVL